MHPAGGAGVGGLILPVHGSLHGFPEHDPGGNRDDAVSDQDAEGREEFPGHRRRCDISVAQRGDGDDRPVDAGRDAVKAAPGPAC